MPRAQSPHYESAVYGSAPLVDAAATHDPETGRTTIFLVNRSKDAEVAVAADVARLGAVEAISAQTLADDDLTARNTWEEPDRIGLADNESAVSTDGVVTVRLPPVSWTAVLLG